MRYFLILSLLCAYLAIATPLNKRKIIWDVITEITYVTVTEGDNPPVPTAAPVTPTMVPVAAPTTDDPSTASPVDPPAAASSETAQGAVDTAAPAPSPAASTIQPLDAINSNAINGHNDVRPDHSAPIFTWNDTLASFAADECSCSQFAHDLSGGGGGYGQNIYAAFSTASDGFTEPDVMKGATDDWYNEISLFNDWGQASPPINDGWLHFTQMIWVASETVGCAVKTCGTDNTIKPDWYVWYVVCNYYPVGNVIGAFDKNVLEN